MTCCVISAPIELRGFIDALLPSTATGIGRRRIYYFYRVSVLKPDYSLHDPIDGAMLIEGKHFNDERAARAWALADDACRSGEVVR